MALLNENYPLQAQVSDTWSPGGGAGWRGSAALWAEECPWGWAWGIYSLGPPLFQFALSAWCLQLDVISYPFPYRQWGK